MAYYYYYLCYLLAGILRDHLLTCLREHAIIHVFKALHPSILLVHTILAIYTYISPTHCAHFRSTVKGKKDVYTLHWGYHSWGMAISYYCQAFFIDQSVERDPVVAKIQAKKACIDDSVERQKVSLMWGINRGKIGYALVEKNAHGFFFGEGWMFIRVAEWYCLCRKRNCLLFEVFQGISRFGTIGCIFIMSLVFN